ncbi:MAG: response regulator [Pseudomonadota bacterium]|nr:response regulator [Pseudomonadota bacterium]
MTTIAIIDDETPMREMMDAVLRRAGYETITACNGIDAAAKLAGQAVDAVITDIFMPEGDGIEVIRNLRMTAPDMPVIAVSGGGTRIQSDYLKAARMLGARDVLTKPFLPQKLVDTVRAAVSDA